MALEISIQNDCPLAAEIRYTLNALSINKKQPLEFSHSGILVGQSPQATVQISGKFVSNFSNQKFSFHDNLGKSGFVEHTNGTPDYLSTAFYQLSCLQEYNSATDNLGRFRFSESYQSHFGISHKNSVQECFDKLAEQLGIKPSNQPTKFYLSHDIDIVYEAVLQDGFYALKHGRIDVLFNLLFHVAMGKPDWLNMDQIMKLESEYDFKSTFFWIVKKGKENGLKNADYRFRSARIQNIVEKIEKSGSFENGLHKSVSTDSFSHELKEFKNTPKANRYHYLKFNLPEGFNTIEQAGLKLDASLGFAESLGFRNGYGMPVNPYRVSERRPYRFVEAPLHVMDRTFYQYQKMTPKQAEQKIINFFEQNRQNCVLSVLWHNNFFTNYKFKGYPQLYKNILSYIRDNNFKTVSQEELITHYSISDNGNNH